MRFYLRVGAKMIDMTLIDLYSISENELINKLYRKIHNSINMSDIEPRLTTHSVHCA